MAVRTPNIPETLIKRLVAKEVVPFVGSGVALAVSRKFPTWGQLLDALALKLERDSKDDSAEIVRRFTNKGQLHKAADEAFEELGKVTFGQVVRDFFDIDQPVDSDLSLPKALWALNSHLIVTTNYDRVFQWSAPSVRTATNSQRANVAELFAGAHNNVPLVWHLHGHIDDPDSLILAPQQYDMLYRGAMDETNPYAAAMLQLRTLITNRSLLFVGFGLQDEYVMDALATVLKIFGRNLRPSYALLKSGDVPTRSLWNEYNIQVIQYEDHGAPLLDLVKKLAEPLRKENVTVGVSETQEAMDMVAFRAELKFSELYIDVVNEISKEALPDIRKKMEMMRPRYYDVFRLYMDVPGASDRYFETASTYEGFLKEAAEELGMSMMEVSTCFHNSIHFAGAELTKAVKARVTKLMLSRLEDEVIDNPEVRRLVTNRILEAEVEQ